MDEFDGETYVAERDRERLTRELDRVRLCMEDGEWRTLAVVAAATGAPEASVSARLRDLRKQRHGSRVVERRYVSNGLWSYRLLPAHIARACPSCSKPLTLRTLLLGGFAEADCLSHGRQRVRWTGDD